LEIAATEGSYVMKAAILYALSTFGLSKREQCKMKIKGYGFLYGLSHQRGGGYNLLTGNQSRF
jgi:hypothetical protein